MLVDLTRMGEYGMLLMHDVLSARAGTFISKVEAIADAYPPLPTTLDLIEVMDDAVIVIDDDAAEAKLVAEDLSNEEVVLVGVSKAMRLPHFVFDCPEPAHPCPQCYCYCCDVVWHECRDPVRHSLVKSAADPEAQAERAQTLHSRKRKANIGCSCSVCNKVACWALAPGEDNLELELPSWKRRAHVMDVLDRSAIAATYRIETSRDRGVALIVCHLRRTPGPASESAHQRKRSCAAPRQPRDTQPPSTVLSLLRETSSRLPGSRPKPTGPRPPLIRSSMSSSSRRRIQPVKPRHSARSSASIAVTNVSTNSRLRLPTGSRRPAPRTTTRFPYPPTG